MGGERPDVFSIAGILLAAGCGARFARTTGGDFKLTASFHGKPLVRHAAEAALAAGVHPLIVATGHECARVLEALRGLDYFEAHNPSYEAGLSTSLRRALAATPETARGALVLLGDMPLTSASLCAALCAAFAHCPDADAVAPVMDGQRGNPVLLARSLFSSVAGLQGDAGARSLLKRPDCKIIELNVTEMGVFLDIDDHESLTALEALA